MPPRYAVYYAPERDSSLDHFGNRWLSRSAETNETFEPPALSYMTRKDVLRLTAAPRHYGFHGTIVPPFFLNDDFASVHLITHLKALALGQQPFDLDPLSVRTVGSFIALVPAGQERIAKLAEVCLRSLKPFRQQPSLAEMERRRAKGLTPCQERLLVDWGYPYVLDEYQFHLTLTDSIPNKDLRKAVMKDLTERTSSIVRMIHPVRELCLFKQESNETPFTLIQRIPLGSS